MIANRWWNSLRFVAVIGIGLGVIITACTTLGIVIGSRLAQPETTLTMPPFPLHAGTAAKGKTMSMATGLITGEVEGLYVLDHASGNLQCWILNPRSGAVGGIYRANVAADLMTDKSGTPDYVMATGNFFFQGGNTGNQVPASSVCYVADESTGNVVGYALSYDRGAINRGIIQAGTLQVVCKGPTRGEEKVRDQ